MRILLLGAAGFIGRELAAALAARGHDVVAVVRKPLAATPLHAKDVVAIDLNRATRPEDVWPSTLMSRRREPPKPARASAWRISSRVRSSTHGTSSSCTSSRTDFR